MSTHPLHRHYSHTDWAMQYFIMALVGLLPSPIAAALGLNTLFAISLIAFIFGAVVLLLASVHCIAANVRETSSRKRQISTLGIVVLLVVTCLVFVPLIWQYF